ncbi:helix-turn-helix transcriptional regulator [Mesorhizobium sp. WSM4307]|uniref:helix-turn-helix domain-containing protein n=1 Tax=unclassified Mesorhizobium TaxID=325217 RepID=UPI000BAF4A67|nr:MULTISPECIES: helix-turn-helix transcriptional regulator [unclassified Mesorhizobium]PBB22332.1 transcriptional regulator [Mesorhizobium sp. WSM4304]PBB74738.1 transcriptional regulator [Mesorhizobium sp. WSM4308]TRC73081.1 helix-turn-helix transcriptional regulator [Mesorhizobium sp. WSM4315]TRC83368.1 helix-turn-helix transcriptional regulator [Mesorhizobium sp. WSM4307]
MPSTLGRKVHSLRRQKGLTLEQLAHATGSSKSYMWEIENKPVARPSAEKLTRVAAVLGVTPEFLLNEEERDPTVSELDIAFFRKYQAADPALKAKLKRILDVLDNDEERHDG